MQGLGEQRVRAEMLCQHDLPGRARDGPRQGGVCPRMRAGQQGHHDRESRPGPLCGGRERLGQAALAAFQIGDLDVSALAGLPGGLGNLAAHLVAGGAGAAGHGDQQGRCVRREAQPVRAAVPAGTAGAAGTAGQCRPVGSWLAALRQGVSALREGLSAAGQWLAALGERVSALGKRVSALREGLSAAGQWVAALGERVSALRQWLAALGERVAAPGQWLAALREGVAAPGHWVAALRERVAAPGQWLAALQERVAAPRERVRSGGSGGSRTGWGYRFAVLLWRLAAPRQRFPALRQRFAPLRQRLRGLAWVSHAAVSYSGFIRHDRRSQMFGSGTSLRELPHVSGSWRG